MLLARVRRAGALTLPLLLVLLGSLTPPSHAAPGDHVWSKGLGIGAEGDAGPGGSVSIAGNFFGTIDFGGGPRSAVNFIGGDLYVARFDGAGNHVFTIQVSPVQSASVKVVRVDATGNTYVLGQVFGDVDFGGGTLTGSNDLYIAKFDPNGNHLLSALYGQCFVQDAAVDATGIAVVGSAFAAIDMGGGALPYGGNSDGIVAKFDHDGNHVFSASFGDTSDQRGVAVALDGAGSPIMAASFFGTTDFGGGARTSTGLTLALVRYDATGAYQSDRVLVGDFTSGITANLSLAAESNGAVALVGELHGSADFGGGALFTGGNTDVFLARFDASDTHLFSASYGSSSFQVPNRVAINADGDAILSGNFQGSIDFGGGVLTTGANSELWVAQIDASGSHVFSQSYAAATSAYLCEVSVSESGEVLVVAGASSDLDLGGGPLSPGQGYLASFEGTGGGSTSAPTTIASALRSLTAYPSPFNPQTTIAFELERPADVELAIFDVRGRQILQRNLPGLRAGEHDLVWRGRDAAGRAVASGVYRIRVRAGEQSRTHSVVLAK